MPDITNYTYIWFRIDNPLLDIEKAELDIIYNIITTFSYPCYLSGSDVIRQLSEAEQHMLIHNELDFIRGRMQMANLTHIAIIQIPRLMYDLFVLIHTVETRKRTFEEIITCEDSKRLNLQGFLTLQVYVWSIQYIMGERKHKPTILDVNRFIINKIFYIASGGPPPTSYNMTDSEKVRYPGKGDKKSKHKGKMVDKSKMGKYVKHESYSDLSESSSSSDSFSSPSHARSHSRSPSPSQVKLPAPLLAPPENPAPLIHGFLSEPDQAFKIILEFILQCDDIYIPAQGFLNAFLLSFTPQTKDLLRQILQVESQITSGYAILYRGSKLKHDVLISDSGHMHSRSFNSSVLSGCISDDTACTLFYIEPTTTYDAIAHVTKASQNDRLIYMIKKYLVHDSSDENSLFFIPPIHPFIQLHSIGELFHPRTKVSRSYLRDVYPTLVKKKQSVEGIVCDLQFIANSDYLQSDKSIEELIDIYRGYNVTRTLDRWYILQNTNEPSEGELAGSAAAGGVGVMSAGGSPTSSDSTNLMKHTFSDQNTGSGRKTYTRKNNRK